MAYLHLRHLWSVQVGGNMEKAYIEVSTDGGSSWKTLVQMTENTGSIPNPTSLRLSLVPYLGKKILLRFRLDSPDSGTFWEIFFVEVQASDHSFLYTP